MKIPGTLDGNNVETDANLRVQELAPNHFLVYSADEATEVFLSPQGGLSDGNHLDGISFQIQSERERIIVERFGQSTVAGKGATNKGLVLKAPMPGMVRAIHVSIGDSVKKNTPVLVLEAMKMENSIAAGFTGKVKRIYVETGLSIEKNGALIEFEPE
ncbi:MAG: biotin/lipoyl-containing protein [bacterium]